MTDSSFGLRKKDNRCGHIVNMDLAFYHEVYCPALRKHD